MSTEVAKRIEELLKLSGISDKGILDEMKDHYLTAIDEKVAQGATYMHAVRSTYQEIAAADLLSLANNKKRKNGLLWILIAIGMIIAGSMYIYSQKSQSPPQDFPIENENPQISASFGKSYHPIHKQMKFHKGIDIKARYGTKVIAPEAGTIVDTGYDNDKGNYIIIKHNRTYSTKYYHLSDVSVKMCQKVSKDDEIGEIGTSGLSTAPHLHYEVLKNGKSVDPMEYINP